MIAKKIFTFFELDRGDKMRIGNSFQNRLLISFASSQINPHMANGVKVSVILPIYNQEKYLAKALESLQNQTLSDIEFICVNDGSNDNSLNILKEYASKDSRIKIINQKNQGCGCARNNGLKFAKGEYIAFLDPDDWLESNALEKLYAKSKKQNCDMVVFNFTRMDESGNLINKYNLKYKLRKLFHISEQENFHWRDVKPRVLGGLFPAAWNKFYHRDLIKKHGLHFAKSNIGEDSVFVFGATLNAKNIGYCDDSLYNYVIHPKSVLHSCSDKNFCLFKSFDSVKKLLIKLGLKDELKQECDSYIVRMVSFHKRQFKSMEKFYQVCQKKLSVEQNKILQERYNSNAKILPILDALLSHKINKI